MDRSAQIVEQIFSLIKMKKRRNTLCILSFFSEIRRERCRQDVCGDLFSVSKSNNLPPFRIDCHRTVCGRAVVFMMRRRGPCPWLGLLLVVVGALIILSMILPKDFWWFILGAAMIGAGLYLMRR